MTPTSKKYIMRVEKLKGAIVSIKQTTGQVVRFVLDNYPKANKAKLARALGVTYATVYNWENNKTRMAYPVYLIFRKLYPLLEIADISGGPGDNLGREALPSQKLSTREAIRYVVAKDPDATQARLARVLGVTSKTLSNYVSGRSRMSGAVAVAFGKLYPAIEVTDVYKARAGA